MQTTHGDSCVWRAGLRGVECLDWTVGPVFSADHPKSDKPPRQALLADSTAHGSLAGPEASSDPIQPSRGSLGPLWD